MTLSRRHWRHWMFLAVVALLLGRSVRAEVLDKTKTIGSTTVRYEVVLPNGYDPAKTYPAVLAFPGGPQTTDMVDATIERNWQLLGERLGYIVIVPEAPNGELFFRRRRRRFFPNLS